MNPSKVVGWGGLAAAVLLGYAVSKSATGGEDDVELVRKQCGAIVAGWNKHDAKAMAAAFAEDGDMIGPMGDKATGRAEIEKAFAADQGAGGPMSESQVEVIKEPVRFITSDVAVSDAEVVVTGMHGPDGSKGGPVNLHVTNVWKKIGGAWYVAASRPYIKPAPGATPPATH